MAKYIGLLTTDMRGKVGGTVTTKGRNGTAIRSRVAGIQPRSPAQLASRANFSAASQLWRGLGASENRAWNELATQQLRSNSLGTPSHLTGSQLFASCCINIAAATQSPLAPVSAPMARPVIAVPLVSGVTMTVTEFGARINATVALPGSGVPGIFVVAATPGLSPGVSVIDAKYLKNFFVYPANGEWSAPDAWAAWFAVFGPFPLSRKVAFRFTTVDPDTGFASAPQLLTCIAGG